MYKWKSPPDGSCILEEKMTPESSGRKNGAKLVPVVVSWMAGVARDTFFTVKKESEVGSTCTKICMLVGLTRPCSRRAK